MRHTGQELDINRQTTVKLISRFSNQPLSKLLLEHQYSTSEEEEERQRG